MRVKLDMPMSVGEITTALGGKAELNLKNRIISFITTDTRELCKGDLYIAIRGKNYNGENFVDEAKRLGGIPLSVQDTDGCITVSDTQNALFSLAKYYKGFLPRLRKTVGITGSVGKSTTKEFLSVIASEGGSVYKSEGNYNNHIGLPLTILGCKRSSEIMVLELGMNSQGEIRKLSKCAEPDIAIITNVGTAHIGKLGTRENIALAKLEIAEGEYVKKVIVPNDEPLLLNAKSRHTFSSSDISADTAVIKSADRYVTVYFGGRRAFCAEFNIEGSHFLNCLAASVAAAYQLGIDSESTKRGISKISSNNIRQNIVSVKDFYVLDDSYNASVESIEADLKFLSSMSGYSARSALLGDVLELGEHAKKIHYEIGKIAARAALSNLYLFGSYSHYTALGALDGGMSESTIYINENRDEPRITAADILKHHIAGEIILFKASHAISLSRVLDLLKS